MAARELAPEPGSAVLNGRLTGDQIKALIVGNSQSGQYENNVAWAEFFPPDGTITGKVGTDGYSPRYEIVGNTICYDYDGSDHDLCAGVGIKAGKLHQFDKDGKLHWDLEDTAIIKGNALEGASEPVSLN